MFSPRRRRHGARGEGFALFLLFSQMANVGFDRIPPVTLAGIGAQVAIYLRLFNIGLPSISNVCVSCVYVWYKEQYQRLFLSPFFHADEWHLYFNMASFLYKGLTLERSLGSGYFVFMIAVFSVLTSTLLVGLGFAAEFLLHDPSYLSQCAVGFSGKKSPRIGEITFVKAPPFSKMFKYMFVCIFRHVAK